MEIKYVSINIKRQFYFQADFEFLKNLNDDEEVLDVDVDDDVDEPVKRDEVRQVRPEENNAVFPLTRQTLFYCPTLQILLANLLIQS